MPIRGTAWERPSPYSSAGDELVALLSRLHRLVQDSRPTDDRTLTRCRVLELARSLCAIPGHIGYYRGEQLLDLVDAQAVHGTLSWSDFLHKCQCLAEECEGAGELLETAGRRVYKS